MRMGWRILALVFLAASSIAFFRYQRPVGPATASGQHYAVIDESIWRHARGDLSDLRLYVGEREIPYALTIEMGHSETQKQMLRVLQPGTIDGKTQFLLDMSSVAEYDRVQLEMATKNFVAHARVEGQDDLHGKQWVMLGTTTLYDLTEEKLGHNSTLQIPLSAYKYLRVKVDNSVKPSDVESATAGITQAEEAVWREVSSDPTQAQKGRDTILSFSVPENVPVERVNFAIDPSQQNFLRGVEIQGNREREIGAGELSRIHVQRNGQKIDVEATSLLLGGAGPGTYRVIIHNGDDAPLKIAGARLQQYERRIYFDSDSGAQPNLYYGDEKLWAPTYDYRKLFQKNPNADPLQLGAEILNAAYAGRLDERPWSERHPGLLWATILAAVVVLGGLAYRSMKTAAT